MIAVFIAGCAAFVAGALLGGMAMALFCAAGNEHGYIAISDEADEDPELTTLRQRLAVTQQAAESQRQRADFYQSLYCEGARANAQLRKGATTCSNN